MWIIFEGLDKTGKTTLEWEFLKAIDFKHMIIDRGPIGYMIFDMLLHRSTKLGDQDFIRQARKIMKGKPEFMVIYCYADEATVNKRLMEHDGKSLKDYKPYAERNYANIQKQYAINVMRYYKPERTLMLDTGKNSISTCVHLIIEKLEEVMKGEL